MANEKLIERSFAKRHFETLARRYQGSFTGAVLELAAQEVAEMPGVDAVEVVHGRWIFGNTLGYAWMKCSECLKSQMPNGCFTYCPNCGAKMDGERKDNV